MNILAITNGIILAIGIPALIGSFIYIGKKLQILDDLQKDIAIIKHNLSVVANFLTKSFDTFNVSELKNYSPVQLTNNGHKFIEEIGFEKVFAENKDRFFEYIDTEKPKLKYDVESAAIKSIYFLANEPYMTFLKVYLYNNPTRKITDTAPTLGIYIRDKYLAAHPEIKE